jgi:hypothetical protein
MESVYGSAKGSVKAVSTSSLFDLVSKNEKEAGWFDIFAEREYRNVCDIVKNFMFTESLILAQDERWRYA